MWSIWLLTVSKILPFVIFFKWHFESLSSNWMGWPPRNVIVWQKAWFIFATIDVAKENSLLGRLEVKEWFTFAIFMEIWNRLVFCCPIRKLFPYLKRICSVACADSCEMNDSASTWFKDPYFAIAKSLSKKQIFCDFLKCECYFAERILIH